MSTKKDYTKGTSVWSIGGQPRAGGSSIHFSCNTYSIQTFEDWRKAEEEGRKRRAGDACKIFGLGYVMCVV